MGSSVELDRVSYRQARGGIHDLSLRIEAGQYFAVVGPAGAGKRTLLRLLPGFAMPERGRVTVDGRNLRTLPPGRSGVVPLFRDLALFDNLDIAGNIGFGLSARGLPARLCRPLVEAAAELVRLTARLDSPVRALSATDRLRVALARALAVEPLALVLDEPLHGLQPAERAEMLGLLQDVQRATRGTFIHLTADPLQALEVAERLGVLRDGRLEQAGTPQIVYERPDTAFVAAYIGANNRFPGRVASAWHGQAVLQTELGMLRGCNPRRIRPGAPAALFVRPERLWLEGYAPNEVDSVVLRRTFDGAYVTMVLRVLPGREIILRRPTEGGCRLPAPGSRVQVRFEPQQALVLPVEAADA